MQCLNEFVLSTIPFSLPIPSNSQTNSSSFQPRIRTQSISHTQKAYHDNNYSENATKKTISLPRNVKNITSTSNPFVKHCVKLRQSSSYRHFHGSAVVVGTTPIREIYSFNKPFQDRPIIECLLVLENFHIPEEIDDPSVPIVRVNSIVMRKLSGVQSVDSVEVIAVVKIPSTFHTVSEILHEEDCRKWFSLPHRILVLDRIQDPGNLGTLLRSATAFRWCGVFLLPGCCDPFNEEALRASRGSSFQIQIVSGNWNHVKNLKQEFQMKVFAGHPTSDDKSNPVLSLSKDFADSVLVCLFAWF